MASLVTVSKAKESFIFEDLLSMEEGLRPPIGETDKAGANDLQDEEVEDEKKDETAVIEMGVRTVNNISSELAELSTDNNQHFESHLEKNYTSSIEKHHVEDLKKLFKENAVDFEKQKFYQQIFNDILENTNQKKLEDLQKQYLEYLCKISNVETFKCSSCDFLTINKTNLKSHLLIIHKTELEFKIFQCLTCKYKTKNLTYLKRHLTSHVEDSASDNAYSAASDFDMPSSSEDTKKRKVKKKNVTIRKCDLCSFKAKDKESFETHKKSHKSGKGNKFKCYACDYENWSKLKLQKHLFKEHAIKTLGLEHIKTLKCDVCPYTTDAKECLRVHQFSHKDPNEIEWFSCAECQFKTKFKRNLHNHVLAVHKPEQIVKKFLCEVCSRSFSTRAKLTNHSLTHKSINEVAEVFQCDQCPYKTKKRYNLKIHMVVHNQASELKTFICDTCGFQTKRKWNYDSHILIHKDASEVELHSCEVCGYTTKFKERLTRHLKRGTHQGGRNRFKSTNYSCLVCNFESANRKTYFNHIQSHDNPDAIAKGCVSCDICGFRTNDKRNLAQHSLTHKSIDEVRMFKCSEQDCEFQTKYRASLHTHIKGHKGTAIQTTLYKCDVCGLQSRRKYDHNMHLITHKSASEVQVFSCTICSYQTKFKAYLKAHFKKRHGIVTTTRGRVINSASNMTFKEDHQT